MSFFVDRFIKYALNNAGMKHLNPNMIRASFYRDVYGLIQNADKMVVLPKDAYLSYHDSVLVPGMRFGEDIRN